VDSANLNYMPVKGYFSIVIAAILMGSGGIVGTVLFNLGLEPLDVVTLRFSTAALVLAIILACVKKESFRIEKKDILLLMLAAFLGITSLFSLFFYAVQQTNVASASILVYTAPAFIVIISYYKLKEPLSLVKVISLFLTFLGCFLISGGYNFKILQFNLLGYAAGVGAGLSYAIYVVITKLLLTKYSQWTLLLYSLLFGSSFLLVLKPPWRLLNRGFPTEVWVITVYMALVITLLAFSLIWQG